MSESALLESLHRLSPQKFEQQVALLLEAEGYHNVRVQGGANDRGVDIVCHDAEGQLVAVQCKRFSPTTTISAMVVQHLVGMALKRKAHRAMLVTTGGFTRPARKQAEEFDVELIDGPMLASLIGSHPRFVAALEVTGVRPEEEEDDEFVPDDPVPPPVMPRVLPSDLAYVILRDLVPPSWRRWWRQMTEGR